MSDHQRDEFAYGSWDCCMFAAGAIEAMTGIDVADGFRGRYHCKLGAQRVWLRAGCGDLCAFLGKVAEDLGLERVPVARAQRGDLVYFVAETGESVGVVALNGREIITTSERGLWRVPLRLAARAWKI